MVISTLNSANRTKQRTHITVAPGHYMFSQAFGSNYGPSVLPMVNTTILIVGADSATTIFDASQVLARIFTVLQAGTCLSATLRSRVVPGASRMLAIDKAAERR